MCVVVARKHFRLSKEPHHESATLSLVLFRIPCPISNPSARSNTVDQNKRSSQHQVWFKDSGWVKMTSMWYAYRQPIEVTYKEDIHVAFRIICNEIESWSLMIDTPRCDWLHAVAVSSFPANVVLAPLSLYRARFQLVTGTQPRVACNFRSLSSCLVAISRIKG